MLCKCLQPTLERVLLRYEWKAVLVSQHEEPGAALSSLQAGAFERRGVGGREAVHRRRSRLRDHPRQRPARALSRQILTRRCEDTALAHAWPPVLHPMPRTHFPNPANKDAMQELLDIQQTVRTLAEQLNRVERYVGAPPRGGRPTATLQAITIGGVQQPFFSGDQLGPLCFDNPDLEQQFFSQVHDRETGTAGGAARSRGTTAPLHPLTHALARPTPSQKQTTIIPLRNRLRRVLRSATCGSRRWSPCSTTMRWLALTLRRL